MSPLKFSSPLNSIFCSGPPQLFWSEIFRSPLKLAGEGSCYHEMTRKCLKNNQTIALSILYIKEKEIYLAYIGTHSSTHEKHIIFLVIPMEEKEGWHYLAVKKVICIIAWIVFILLSFMKKYICKNNFLNTELFRKPDNWWQIYKQISSTFYASNSIFMCEEEKFIMASQQGHFFKNLLRFTRMWNGSLITFLKNAEAESNYW